MHPEIILALSIDEIINRAREEEAKKDKYSLLNKKYVVRDNSYAREIVNGGKMPYHCDLRGVPCIIISKPYITEVKTFQADKRQRMVRVKSLKSGLIYEVMFAEAWIIE